MFITEKARGHVFKVVEVSKEAAASEAAALRRSLNNRKRGPYSVELHCEGDPGSPLFYEMDDREAARSFAKKLSDLAREKNGFKTFDVILGNKRDALEAERSTDEKGNEQGLLHLEI